ncbi:MAG: type IX secretion system protein PorQ [Bacteroidales bacterium]
MKKKYGLLIKSLILFAGVFYSQLGQSQNGGRGAFQFLNTTTSARGAALGSDFLSVYDGDLSLALANPSLINSDMHNSIGLNYVNYFNGINYGVAQYSRTFDKIGSFAAGVQYFNYGQFDAADESGERLGTFSASDLAFTIGWGRALSSRLSVGANIKGVYSSYETYTSFGLGTDVVFTYHDDEHQWAISLAGRNIGAQLKPFHEGNNESMPFDLQLAVSKKLLHLPLRIFAVVDEIDNWNIYYDDPDKSSADFDAFSGEVKKESGFERELKNALKHLRIGGELTIAKRLNVRLGYNFRTRTDLRIANKPGTVGLSWGVGLNLNRFKISYSRSAYHLEGSPNWFSISTNLSKFK